MRTPEEQRAYSKQWYERNRIKHREYYRRWYQKNADKQRAYSKEYYRTKVKNCTPKREKRKYNKIDVNELHVKRGDFTLKFE